VALFSVFMGATDGVSLGSIVFPHDDGHSNADYASLGISMGLLAALVSNGMNQLFSQFPHAVGGLVMPVIPIMASYFRRIGPGECPTIMVAIPLMTACCGTMTYLMGVIGVQTVVKVCPFVVFGGLVAGTGAQLIELSLSMMYPGFVSFNSWSHGVGTFLEPDFWRFCTPGIAVGLFTFLMPRHHPGRDHTFLMSSAALALVGAFYLVWFGLGGTLAEAQEAGWVFNVPVPERLDFYKLWQRQDLGAVRWELLCSADFVLTTLEVFAMELLVTTTNIIGIAEVTHWKIDVDREVRSAGLQCVCCGLVGGLPGNVVMSFSVSAHKLGMRTKRFSWHLTALSAVVFLAGDYVVAVLPKMVPACVLFWLGLVLVVYWLWDGVGAVSPAEHAVVLLMIVVDLFLGVGPMLALGILLTLVVSATRMMAMGLITEEQTLLGMRSDVLRTGTEANMLLRHGGETLILKLARGYFSFMNASSVLDRVQEVLSLADAGSGPPLQLLVLQFQDVLSVDTSALNALQELLSVAQRRGFRVLLSGCVPSVEAAVLAFGVPAEPLVGCHCQGGSEEAHSAAASSRAMARAAELARQPGAENRLLLMGSARAARRRVPAMALALEFCETFTLVRHPAPESWRACPCCAMAGAEPGPNLLAMRDAVLQGAGLEASHPALALLVDVHTWLAGHFKEYDVRVLREVAEALEMEHYQAGQSIYAYDPGEWPQWQHADAGREGPAPPLVWLVAGEVEHLWTGHRLRGSRHLDSLEQLHALEPYRRLEKASLPLDNLLHCLGCFQTSLAFFGQMLHAGQLLAVTDARCVLLRRSGLARLAAASPEGHEALQVYLAKKRFVASCHNRCGGPSPLL